LLIVITVIGILVGILLPAVRGAFNSANELSVRAEMIQIEQAVEAFRTEFGFYPPSFEQFNRGSSAADLSEGVAQFSRFLNRIAPNHQETNNFGGGAPRIVAWWNKIGRHLDQQSSLVFWLSGMCESKQFPLTGGSPGLIEPFNGPARFIATPSGNIEIERNVFFDFQPNQLVFGSADGADPIGATDAGLGGVVRDANGAVVFLDADSAGSRIVAAYQQGAGPSSGDLLFRYRDASSYGVVPYAYLTDVNALVDADGDGNVDDPDPAVFANPKSFQLISLGLDGEAGLPNPEPMNDAELRENAFLFSTDSNFVLRGYDNMVNFAAGRLELFVIENE